MPQMQSEKSNVKATDTQLDIINMIEEDHKPLKQLIKILKDEDKDINKRKAAFEEFAILLVTHAKPEEQTLYIKMKQNDDLRSEALEGDVEHQLADQLLEEVKRTKNDDDLWTARAKVLAELVEHHIEEEEDELLPDFKKESTAEERMKLGQKFLQLKTALLEQGGVDSPEEKDIKQ